MNKIEQRQEIKSRLKSLENKDILSDKVYSNLISLNLLKGKVLIYNSINSEVSTNKLVEYYKDKVELFMPKVIGDDMVFIRVDENTKYSIGAFGIKEPIGKEYTKEEIDFDVCVTPLLGFDKNLNRLGKGKGYYDRFFENNNCLKIGLAFSCQEMDKIDTEETDIKLDYIVTDLGVISESN